MPRYRSTWSLLSVIAQGSGAGRGWLPARMLALGLLAGCAGQAVQPMQEDVPPAKSSPRASRATNAQDILAEWGTFGADGVRGRPSRKAMNAASRETLLSGPDYSLSVNEIVANATCRACEDKPYHRMVVAASNQHGVPAGLIHAVIQKESGYNPGATSHRQARGLMQITPDTARFVGVGRTHNLYDPQTNINAGTAYLKYLMQTHFTFDSLLAAYNAGPGNVRKYNGVPPFAETRRYIQDVKRYYSVTSRD